MQIYLKKDWESLGLGMRQGITANGYELSVGPNKLVLKLNYDYKMIHGIILNRLMLGEL